MYKYKGNKRKKRKERYNYMRKRSKRNEGEEIERNIHEEEVGWGTEKTE